MSLETQPRTIQFLKRWLRAGLTDDVIESLSKFPLLSNLTAREIEVFGRFLEKKEVDANVNLFNAGDRGVTLFMLETGSVDILKVLPDGSEKRLTSFTDRSFIGEIALLSDTTRTATARSTSACRMWMLYREDFQGMCSSHPAVGAKLLWSLAAEMGMRLARTNELVAQLVVEGKKN